MLSDRKSALLRAGKFCLALLPIAVAAGFCIAWYEIQSGILNPSALAYSLPVIIAIVTLQTVFYALFCGFTGYLMASALGLNRPFGFQKRPLCISCGVGVACGILFYLLDAHIFAGMLPEVSALYVDYRPTVIEFLAKVLYGGVMEEVFLRLFALSLFAWLLWKVFCRKAVAGNLPAWILVVANVLAATLFALGHLPATQVLFGRLTALIVLRCMLLNGVFGFAFGYAYTRYGIQYAMLAHALTHVVCILCLILF